jgi:hypothetical protein
MTNDQSQHSPNHSLVAEMIRRCNSRSAALPLALDLDPALNLDWVKERSRSRSGARADLDLRLFSEQIASLVSSQRFSADYGTPPATRLTG